MVNNHNHSSDSLMVDQDAYDSTQAEFTTGSAISPFLSTGSVLTLDELPISSSGDLSNPPASPTSSSSSSSSSSPNPFPPLHYIDQQQLIPMSSSSDQMMTVSPPRSSLPPHTNTTDSDLHTSSGPDHRPRWVDYRSRPSPAFPPRVPGIHGIPSGFRNPVPAVTPAYGAQTVHNPQLVHSFGGSSTNPVGFAGSVPPAPASFPASNANQDRRRPTMNITRVERK